MRLVHLLGIIGVIFGLGMVVPIFLNPIGNQAVLAEWTAVAGILIAILAFFGWIVLGIIVKIFSSVSKREKNSNDS